MYYEKLQMIYKASRANKIGLGENLAKNLRLLPWTHDPRGFNFN